MSSDAVRARRGWGAVLLVAGGAIGGVAVLVRGVFAGFNFSSAEHGIWHLYTTTLPFSIPVVAALLLGGLVLLGLHRTKPGAAIAQLVSGVAILLVGAVLPALIPVFGLTSLPLLVRTVVSQVTPLVPYLVMPFGAALLVSGVVLLAARPGRSPDDTRVAGPGGFPQPPPGPDHR